MAYYPVRSHETNRNFSENQPSALRSMIRAVSQIKSKEQPKEQPLSTPVISSSSETNKVRDDILYLLGKKQLRKNRGQRENGVKKVIPTLNETGDDDARKSEEENYTIVSALQCKNCKYLAPNIARFLLHWKATHEKKRRDKAVEPLNACPYCPEVLNFKAFTTHAMKVHPELPCHACRFCDMKFFTPVVRVKHMKQMHKRQVRVKVEPNDKEYMAVDFNLRDHTSSNDEVSLPKRLRSAVKTKEITIKQEMDTKTEEQDVINIDDSSENCLIQEPVSFQMNQEPITKQEAQ